MGSETSHIRYRVGNGKTAAETLPKSETLPSTSVGNVSFTEFGNASFFLSETLPSTR